MRVGASTRPYCDVLRKDDLDGAIRGRMTWQDNPQRRVVVFLCHHQLQAGTVTNASGQGRRGRLKECVAGCWYRQEKKHQADNPESSLEHYFVDASTVRFRK
jgi:hypothetical protein